MPTTRYRLPLLAESQNAPHITHNEALALLDALAARVALSATTTNAPGSPAEGEAYIVPTGASGFGTAAAGEVAVQVGGAWHVAAPPAGEVWRVQDEPGFRVSTGSGWTRGAVADAQGFALGVGVVGADLVISGASSTVLGLIPERAVVVSVTARVLEEISGATGFRVGTSGADDLFGSGLGMSVGAENIGVVAPFPTYAPEDVVITAEGGSFTAGRVWLSVGLILPGVPA